MSIAENSEDKIRGLCKDPEYAMALFLVAFVRGDTDEDIMRNAELYGLDKGKFEEVLNVVNSIDQRRRTDLVKILQKISIECTEKFTSELEKISIERIKNLKNSEVEALKYASYIINLFKRPHYDELKVFWVWFSDDDALVESLYTFPVSRDEAQKIARVLLAKTGIAFYYFSSSRRHDYYHYIIPPYAIKIIDELAKDQEEKVKKAVEQIQKLNDAKIWTALLIMFSDKFVRATGRDIFEEVYGIDFYDYLDSLRFPGLVYDRHVNYAAENVIKSVAISLIKSRFEKIYEPLKKALNQKGFEITLIREPNYGGLYYAIHAVKPGGDVVIYIMPFPYTYSLSENAYRKVVVVEGPIARPDTIRRFFGSSVIVGMDNNFEKIKITLYDNNDDLSKEIIEIFNSLNITSTTFSVPSSTASLSKPSTPLSTAPLPEKDYLGKIRSFQSQARDILEAIVAAVLQDLGFKVEVDYQVRSKDGATREVDVWAWKTVSGVDFSVYVSCKNLDKEIGTPIIDQEAGRVDQLQKAPNMKFIVASKFIDQAKRAAIADGFIPIEIGFKVDESNAIEAYKRVYEVMNGVFTAIAPKRLQQLAESISKVSEELRKVSDELSRLASSSQQNP